jgi:hypothetical protein
METLIFVLIAAECVAALGLVFNRYSRTTDSNGFAQLRHGAMRYARNTPGRAFAATAAPAVIENRADANNEVALAKWLAALAEKVGELKSARDAAISQADRLKEEIARLSERERALARRVAALEGHETRLP